MQRFEQFDVALAKFKNYPLWPVRVIQNGKDSKGKPTYLVFCYGSHDEFRLIDANLQKYDPKTTDSSTPAVKKAFAELANTPEIYQTLSKTFLALKARGKVGSTLVSSSVAPIYEQLVATEAQLEKTKSDLLENITQKVTEKFNDSRSMKEPAELIISQVYDAITLEFNPKFAKIEQALKGLRTQIENLEDRIIRIETKLDDFDQESLLDSLVFHGAKQLPSVESRTAILQILNSKMSLTELSPSDLINVYRLRLNNQAPQTEESSTRVAPIIVKFSSKDVARKVFKAKARLASTGIFISESLTKRRRDILNAAKDIYGPRNAWSDQGQILAKPSVGSAIKKIRSIADCI